MAQGKKNPAKKEMSEAEKQAHSDALRSESKADKFRRLAMKRVPKAIKALASVENLANYDYSDDQAAKVMDVIGGAYKRIQSAFSGQKAAAETFTV